MAQPTKLGEFFDLRVRDSRIQLFGDLRLSGLMQVTSAVYKATQGESRAKVCLDLTDVTTITHSVVPPLAANFRRLFRDRNVQFDLIEPSQATVRAKIHKLGLSHYIDHQRYEKPKLISSAPSVLQFQDHDERAVAVEKVLNAALRTASMDRTHLAALEWAVNEITDNVLTHANSKIGGFLISHHIPHRKIIEFTVADAGMGIAASLGQTSDIVAVEEAVKEGVTRNKQTNQGNGLYGTYRLAVESSGVFVLKSGTGNLYITADGQSKIVSDKVPFRGTYLVCQLDYSDSDILKRALVFKGRPHSPPYDYIERKHELDNGNFRVHARDMSNTLGSRQSGSEARRYIQTIISGEHASTIDVDFTDVAVISSSFADEVFGKLFVTLGPIQFMRRVKITNASDTITTLIDRAITLRTQTGLQL